MLCVGIGDGIVYRLCGALVVVEKIRGLDGEFPCEECVVSVFLCCLRSKVSSSRSGESISGRSWSEPVITGRATGAYAPIAKPISIMKMRIQISSLAASATAISSAS